MIDRIYSQYPQVIFCQNTLVYQGIPTYNCGTTYVDMKKINLWSNTRHFQKTNIWLTFLEFWKTFDW